MAGRRQSTHGSTLSGPDSDWRALTLLLTLSGHQGSRRRYVLPVRRILRRGRALVRRDWISLRLWVVCAALLPVLGGLILKAAGADVPVGSVAEWVAALATIGALIAAMVAAHFAANQLRIESDREDARLRADQQAQAALVSAWPVDTEWQDANQDLYSGGLTFEDGPLQGVRVQVRNASAAPVTNVVVDVSLVTQKPGRDRRRHHVGIHRRWRLVAPGEDLVAWVNATTDVPHYDEDEEWWPEVQIHFVDSVGRNWVRFPVGELMLVDTPD